MTQPLPSHDHLDDCARRSGKLRRASEAGDLNLYIRQLTELICEKAAKRPYKVLYYFDHPDCPYATEALRVQLRDWVNQQPGYKARLDWTAPRWLSVKVLAEKKTSKRRWPFFLRWIPGLGG